MTTQTQKWLITGASGGLGLMLAKQVLANGHQLVATTRNPSSMADLLAQYPNQLTTEALDISNIDDIKAFASKHQAFDVIVNNAGGAIIGAMEEMSDADIEQQLSLNLLAPIHLTRAFLPAMRAQKSGTLVYVTSIGGAHHLQVVQCIMLRNLVWKALPKLWHKKSLNLVFVP